MKQLSHNAGQCHASRQRDPQSSTRKSKDCAKKAEVDKCSQLLTCIFTCSLTHSLTHSFIHSLTHSLTPSLLPLHSSPTPHSTLHLISPTSFHAPSLTLTHALTPARPYFIQVPSLYAIHWTDAAYFFLPSLVCFIPTLLFKTSFPESACAKGSSKKRGGFFSILSRVGSHEKCSGCAPLVRNVHQGSKTRFYVLQFCCPKMRHSRTKRVSSIKNSWFFVILSVPVQPSAAKRASSVKSSMIFCDVQCLLRLGEKDLILKLRQEDLPSKAASRRCAF